MTCLVEDITIKITLNHCVNDLPLPSIEVPREAEFQIGKIEDAEMIKMYATENATQRGNSGTAIAGTVASALRFISKHLG
jgi:hypothetical protein